MSKSPKILLAHVNDAEWIIALWLAIHGGDPAPERVAAQAIAALAPLAAGQKHIGQGFAEVRAKVEGLGLHA
jgi:hypothetical protein